MREKIKEAVLKIAEEMELGISKIILFGSRARNEATKWSDWDILVVVKGEISREKKWEFARRIRKECARELIDVEPFIKSEKELEHCADIPGHIVKTALKEGVVL
ncbi:hypothetical protein DRQ18_03005 [bacterium]|nr:MAG: hypothetical protein DRQ18_03005 [bacterium]